MGVLVRPKMAAPRQTRPLNTKKCKGQAVGRNYRWWMGLSIRILLQRMRSTGSTLPQLLTCRTGYII